MKTRIHHPWAQVVFALLVLFILLPTIGLAQEEPAAPVPTDALIDALEDPDARARLIDALRSADAPSDASEPVAPAQTLAAWAAQSSVELINEIATGAVRVLQDLSRLTLLPELLTPERRARIQAEAWPLAFTILATVTIFRVLRTVSRRMRVTHAHDESAAVHRARVFLAQAVLRVMSLLLAWVSGYTLASFVFADGEPLLSQAFYLNAFVIFGTHSIALSFFVSHHPRDLTFSNLPLRTQATIYRNVRRTFALFIYGLAAVVPIAQVWTNFVIARSLRTAVVTFGVLGALYAIQRIARVQRAQSKKIHAAASAENGTDVLVKKLGFWERVWPWFAVAYVLVSYTVALANPNLMVELVGVATLFSAASLAAILVASRLFWLAGQQVKVVLPPTLDDALPPLKDRLSGLLPSVFVAMGGALIAAALILFVHGWRLVDVSGWLLGGGNAFLWRIATIVMVSAVLILAWSVLTAWIDTRLSEDLTGQQVSARARTLLALFKNVLTIALLVFGGMTALSELGIDIAPLLAGAGVIGLAIGFGAQKLVQDIITGIFIQLENAINEGDVITVAGVTGTVEKLTIRSVGLRDLAGVYHLIPFSAVDTVSNFMRRFAYHVEVVGVAYDSDLEAAKAAMHRAFDTLKTGVFSREITAPLEWHGVISLGDSSVNLRARIKTRPGHQWAVGRAYTAEVKRELDAAEVEIPFPHRELKLPKEMLDILAERMVPGPPKAAE
ncbi:MAG: mechanosensitive ion channel domain-containing protein [Pseudomonadota bacterium]